VDEYLYRLSNAVYAPRRPGRIHDIRSAFGAWLRYGDKRVDVSGYGPRLNHKKLVILAFGAVCAALSAFVCLSLL